MRGDGTPDAPATSSGRRSRRPLAPAVVIAGAGSGKTTLMAARVVYLVLTGQVRPDEVLGLTFTTKAASELRAPDPRRPCSDAGALAEARARRRRGGPRADGRHLQRLRRHPAHRPRPADRPRARHPGRHRRRPLPARRPRRRPVHRRRSEHLTDHPETAIQNLLALDARDERAPVDPDDVRARRRRGPVRLRAARWPRSGPARTARPTASRSRRRSPPSTAAPSCSAWSRPTAGSRPTSG